MSRAQLSLIPMALSVGHGCGASDSGNRCKNPLGLEMIDGRNGAILREICRLIFCNLLEVQVPFPRICNCVAHELASFGASLVS
jgi:hypothetical protein